LPDARLDFSAIKIRARITFIPIRTTGKISLDKIVSRQWLTSSEFDTACFMILFAAENHVASSMFLKLLIFPNEKTGHFKKIAHVIVMMAAVADRIFQVLQAGWTNCHDLCSCQKMRRSITVS
jgi:hypothetical protein